MQSEQTITKAFKETADYLAELCQDTYAPSNNDIVTATAYLTGQYHALAWTLQDTSNSLTARLCTSFFDAHFPPLPPPPA